MPTILVGKGDGIRGKRIIHYARKVEGPRLFRRSGQPRGLWGKLADAEAYVDLPIETTRR